MMMACMCGCGKLRPEKDSQGRKRRYINGHSNPLIKPGHTGPKCPRWKGGRRQTNGYIRIWNPIHHYVDADGYVYEHRLVVERYLGCSMLPWGVVHHMDGDKKNNVYQNLMPMMDRQHKSIDNRWNKEQQYSR